MSTNERLVQAGLTWRSILAIIFAAAIILPVSLSINLLAGITLASAATYLTAVLFAEIARITGRPLTKQEMFIIYSASGLTATSIPFLDYVWRLYFRSGTISYAFTDLVTGRPLPELLPSWFIPPLSSPAYTMRTFFTPDLLVPIAIYTAYWFLWLAQEIAITYIGAELYVHREKLDFPMATVDSQVCLVLTERHPDRFRIFTVTFFVGFAYAVVVYGAPLLTQGAISPIPIPWVDLTPGTYGIEKVLPGAVLGLATDPLSYLMGFIIPFNAIASMAIGSFAIWIFGSWYARIGLASLFSDWLAEWRPGMTSALVYQRAYLRVWIGPLISFALATAVLGVFQSRKAILDTFKTLARASRRQGEGGTPLYVWLCLYLLGTVGSVVLVQALYPDFPVWITTIVSVGVGFFYALVSARAMAETGFPIIGGQVTNYIWYGSIFLSGYQGGVGPFLQPPAIGGWNSPKWTSDLKVAQTLETRPIDYAKAIVLATVAFHVFSFVYVSIFWMAAPIPSSIYPATMIYWPVRSIEQALWTTRQITVFKPEVMIGSFAIILGLGAVVEALTRFITMPFSLVAFVTGASMLPAYSIPILIGGILGRLLFRRAFGPTWWTNNRSVVVAGIMAGEGVVVGICVAIAMLSKAAWILPY